MRRLARSTLLGALVVFSVSSSSTARAEAADVADAGDADAGSSAVTPDGRSLLREAARKTYEGKLVEARELATTASKRAREAGDSDTADHADELAKSLATRIAHVTFALPAGFADVEVSFDDRAVAPDNITRTFSVDPGIHHVAGRASRDGKSYVFETDITLEDAQSKSIALALVEDPMRELYDELQFCAMMADEHACDRFQKCLDAARVKEDQLACAHERQLARTHACGACSIGRSELDPRALVSCMMIALALCARRAFVARNLRR
jgi:hypothetical protein